MVIGLTTQDIASPADGYVTTMGYVRQIKTDYVGWAEGDKLYVSKTVAGELTKVEPTAPHHSDVVATVEIVGGAGIGALLVNINQHKTLDELSDVDGSDPDATGDLLTYDVSGKWERNAYNITDYLKRDQTTPDTTVGTFTFPSVKVSSLTATRIPFASTGGLLTDSSALTMTPAGLMTLTGTTVIDGFAGTGKLTLAGIAGTGNQVGSVVSMTGGAGGTSATTTSPAGGGVTMTGGLGGTNATGLSVVTPTGGVGGGFAFVTGGGGDCNSTAFVSAVGGNAGIFSITGGKGGAVISTGGTRTGGAGGAFTSILGQGGDAQAGQTGGAGGTTQLTSGKGGISSVVTGSLTNKGGVGGSFQLTGGEGGLASNGLVNNGGNGGNFAGIGGAGGAILGAGKPGNGGPVTFVAGRTGTADNLQTSPATSGTVNFFSGDPQSTGTHGNNGGAINFTTYKGGNSTRAGLVNVGGNAGSYVFISGDGGNASAGTTNTGGNAGDFTFTLGIGGTGATANGLNGNFILESGATEIARFSSTTFTNLLATKLGSATNYTNVTNAGRLSYVGSARKVWNKYTADTVTLTNGTSANTVADLRTMTDGLFYNVTEAAGVPGINLIVDFINVTAFEKCRVLGAYEGSATHAVAIQLYNWTTATWDTFNALQNSHADVTTAGGYILNNEEFTVYDDTNYIGTAGNLGKVRVRFYHTDSGNVSHDMHIDEVSLRQ
jgi:hypothetical protein